MTIKLYVKEHKSGLKYLGKTEAKNPDRYAGSGTRWLNHLKVHGGGKKNVTTTILFESEDKEEIKEKGLYYSELWNIVEDPSWANLKLEEGDGGFTHINSDSELKKQINRKAVKTCIEKGVGIFSEESKKKSGNFAYNKEHQKLCSELGKKALKNGTPEQKKRMKKKMSDSKKGEKNSQYNKPWYIHPDAKLEDMFKMRTKIKKEGYILVTEWTRKRKGIQERSTFGLKWYNDGEKEYYLAPYEDTTGLIKGRLKKNVKFVC